MGPESPDAPPLGGSSPSSAFGGGPRPFCWAGPKFEHIGGCRLVAGLGFLGFNAWGLARVRRPRHTLGRRGGVFLGLVA